VFPDVDNCVLASLPKKGREEVMKLVLAPVHARKELLFFVETSKLVLAPVYARKELLFFVETS
jgi:hypothetical protein